MAGTDKNTNRGHASGSADQSPQSPGEVASGAVATESTGALKPATSVKPAGNTRKLSHEAKLGIMVIMVLVFSFGFIVYRKMDLHQQRLTQASIGAQGAVASNDATEVSAESTGDPLEAASRDELNARVSPFADPFGGATEPLAAESTPKASEAIGMMQPEREPTFAFTEPSPEEASSETTEPFPSLAPAPSETNAVDLSAVTTTSADEMSLSNEEPQLVLNTEDTTAEVNGNGPISESATKGDDQLLAESSFQNKPPAADSFEGLAAQPEPAADPVADADSFSAITEQQTVAVGSESNTELQLDAETSVGGLTAERREELASGEPEIQMEERETGTDATPNSAVEDGGLNNADFPELAAADAELPTPGEAAAEQSMTANSEGAAGTTATSDPEPVLIAMAEPKQEGDFFGGFTPEAAQPSPPDASREDFPAALDTTQDRSATSNAGKTSSAGFDAVTRPATRERRNVLRNASGSGADGKFSLAAFNYQNGSAVEATEDGTKHDSVVVQQGENYTKISKRVYGTTRYFSALAVFNQNRIPDPSKMRPGMIVLTPEAHILEERYPQLFVDLQPRVTEPAMFMLLEDGSPAYRVGERETLSEISKRYLGRSSRWVEIYQMNESAVKDPNKLKPGTILALPNDAAEVNVMQ